MLKFFLLPLVCLTVVVLLQSNDVRAATNKKDLVRACVAQKKLDYVNTAKSSISGKGDVMCSSADIVGFPPKERKHNQNHTITIKAPSGRVFCEDPNVKFAVHSSNGGGRQNHAISKDRKTLTVPIYCRGAGLTLGRRWYDVTVTADICRTVTEDMVFDFTLECAEALKK